MDDWILLERAVMQGHESVVRVLLYKEVDVNMKNGNGQTLLSLAIEKGNESAVRVLLDNEAHPNVKTGDNRTPLSLATEKGHKSLAKILLDKGADPEARDNKNGWTPLLWAVASAYERAPNRYEIQPQPRYEAQRLGLQDYQMQLMMLEQQNRKRLIATENPTAIFKLLLEKGANVDVKDEDNQTPLSWAARKGQEPIVKLLLEKDVDRNTKDNFDRTPLSWAAMSSCYNLTCLYSFIYIILLICLMRRSEIWDF